MRRMSFVFLLAAGALSALAISPASARERWSLDGNTGITVGDQTDPSFGWWAGVHRWIKPTLALGVDAGRLRWASSMESGVRPVFAAGFGGDPFKSLARGGNELQHLSGSIRIRGNGFGGSATSMTLGYGAYRQVIREAGDADARDGRLRQGFSLGLGIAGTQWIAPGIELRGDWVDTEPRASSYFTAALGVHLQR
jgi:hypothetical protein